jgi:tRNA dimethylallyltransferase
MNYNFITVLGPTAVGKTRLAAKLAHFFKGEIISADSRQVYKGMDIGTGKDYEDYIVENKRIEYHLIDILEPSQEFDLFDFKKQFYLAYNKIVEKQKLPFLVGGTGLYIHSILKNYSLPSANFKGKQFSDLSNLDIKELIAKLKSLNPALHNTTDLKIKERVIKAIIIAEAGKKAKEGDNQEKLNSLVIGINLSREKIKENITIRLKERLNNGMIEEVEKLAADGISAERFEFFGLEYKYISKYLTGELRYNDMYQKLNSSIHKFAKRQMTWFRKMEKEGENIHWVEGPDYINAKKIILNNYIKPTR